MQINRYRLYIVFCLLSCSIFYSHAQYAPTDDLDGDTIINSLDIDDDNDGIPDAVESPNCFYKENEALQLNGVTTQIPGTIFLVNVWDNNLTTTFNFPDNVDIDGLEVFNFFLTAPIELTSVEFNHNTGTSILEDDGAELTAVVLQAFNGSVWVNLTGTLDEVAMLSPIPITMNQGAYVQYRLLGIDGHTNNLGTVTEILVTSANNYIPSLNPKPSCTDDVDGDGIYNHQDLDSDGDNCSDLTESNSGGIIGNLVTENPAYSGVGTNGLADNLETTPDSNQINYTVANFYIDDTRDACIDTDNDGVNDPIDLDDDNDGITDVDEGFCDVAILSQTIPTDQGTPWTVISPLQATKTVMYLGNLVTITATLTNTTGVSPQIRFNGTGHVGFTNSVRLSWGGSSIGRVTISSSNPAMPINLFLIDFDDIASLGPPQSWIPVSSEPTVIPPNWQQPGGTGTEIYAAIPTVANNGEEGEFNFVQSWPLVVDIGSNNPPSTFANVGLDVLGVTQSASCNIDTDSDGIPDYLDLDSDGDGCNDANEAYANAVADGGDSGIWGPDLPTLANGGVNANGLVIAAGANISGDAYTTIPTTTSGGQNASQAAVTVSVTENPVDVEVCEDENVTFTVTATATIAPPTTPPTTASTDINFQWQVSTDGGTSFTDIIGESGTVTSGTQVSLTVNGVTPAMNGNVYNVVFTNEANICPQETQALLTVNALPVLANLNANVCNDQPSGVILDVASGSVAAATYNITEINMNGLVASAGNPVTGTGFAATEIVDDAYTNTIGSPVDVIYTVEPVSASGCIGNPVDVIISVNPEPQLAVLTANVCSDEVSGITLAVVPGSVAAATYNITTINMNGLVASAGNPVTGTGFAATEIADDAYTNTTGSPVDVIYTVEPVSASGCIGQPVDVTVTINPEPQLAMLMASVCSDETSGITLAVAPGSVAAATYNITTINMNGLVASAGNPVTGTGFAATEIVDDAYANTTGSPVNVIYTVEPVSASGCIGNPVDVIITVNPEPQLAVLIANVCSDEVSGITLAVVPGSVAAATYNITTINMNGLVASAGNPVTGTGLSANEIADDAYANITGAPVDVIYTVEPISASGCVGVPVDVIITINPIPEAPVSSGDLAECVMIPVQVLDANDAITAGVGIIWYDAPVGGNIISIPILNFVGTVTYYAESTNGSCSSITRTPVTLTISDCSITIEKDGEFIDANGNGISDVGESILYTFTITNTGNVPLTNVTLTDNNAVVSGGPIPLLLPGATDNITFTGVHIITQEDIDAGYVYNLATVDGTDPYGGDVADDSADPTPCTTCPIDPDCPDCTIVGLIQNLDISIIKTGVFDDNNGDGYAIEGETITYTFTVTNTGNVTLYDVTVTDPLPGAVITGGPIPVLLPGESDSITYTATYPLNTDDINNGFVENQATATGSNLSGETTSDLSDDNDNFQDDPTIVPFTNCSEEVDVYNLVTPNNDGLNDFFIIENLACIPDNHVSIFNRWGVLVYETDNYGSNNNYFRGISEGRVTVKQKEELPVGTYYYVIHYTSPSGARKSKAGYLHLSR